MYDEEHYLREIERLRMLLLRTRRLLDPALPVPTNLHQVVTALLEEIDRELENTD